MKTVKIRGPSERFRYARACWHYLWCSWCREYLGNAGEIKYHLMTILGKRDDTKSCSICKSHTEEV
jgi:hypothetical protein